ncbi:MULTISPECIES: RDD family protein [unclassified Endozoicomonas]|uniref:RDD family protein n=1 Tax=unclassified Endozoicomonas TaxID=2644528 RepID=UPI003BB653F4
MSGKEVEKFGTAYEYAGFWVRFGASIIDSLIIFGVTLPWLMMIYGEQYFYSEDFIQGGSDFLLSYVMPFVATVLFWVYKSATPGKMAIKAIVVDEKTGNKPTIQQSVIRYIGYFLSMLPIFLGFFWVAWDGKKQGWHDKLAGTVVIRPKNRGVENVEFSGN